MAIKPLSTRRKPTPTLLFVFFILIGGLVFYGAFVRPAVRILEARNWTETPCRIVSSQVGSHSGKGTTYSVDIIFAYNVGGRGFTSAHYNFMGGSSSGYAGKREIVDRYPPGLQTVCYVNPSDPSDAVIEQRFTNDMLFGLFPLVFVGIGTAGLIWRKKTGNQETNPITGTRPLAAFGAISSEPLKMKPAATRVGNLAKMVALTVVWNGFVSGFIYLVFRDRSFHRTDLALMVFVSLFGLVGLVLVGATVRAVLQLFDPQMHLRLSPGALKPGGVYTLEWESQSGRRPLSQMRITLECSEKATCPGGRNGSYTVTEQPYTAEWLNSDKREELSGGKVEVKLPQRLMHSLETGSNRIVWVVRVKGKVRGWAGINDEYPVVMLPEQWKEMA